MYQWAQIMSLDVALGALASGGLVAWWTRVEMPKAWWVALPVSVWVIYTLDHLLDAHRLKGQAHTPRHLFHHRYFTPIAIIWGIAFLTCVLGFPWFLPVRMLVFALGMGGMVLIHLGLVWIIGDRTSPLFHKEVGVGFIYALGVWGGPLSLMELPMPITIWLGLGQFFLLALINLLVFSMYEHDIDELDGHTSFVRAIGTMAARQWVGGSACGVVLAGIFFVGLAEEGQAAIQFQVIYALMLAGLVLVAFRPNWFQADEKYRLWGDLVFLFPVLIWLMG